VKNAGLEPWIDMQLFPGAVPEAPALTEMLQPLESLRLSTLDIVQRYSTNQLVEEVTRGRQAMPESPVLRAFVTRQQQLSGGTKSEMSMAETPTRMEGTRLLADQLEILRGGLPEERCTLIGSLNEYGQEVAVTELTPSQRTQVFNALPARVRRNILMLNSAQQVVNHDLWEGKVLRAIHGRRQLLEVLVDFWYNHFNVYLDKGADRYLIPSYERDSIRPFVLGNFRTLLGATARSPAMLFYLDNYLSAAPARDVSKRLERSLNENYARELLELHTLGVNGGYTQDDVIEVARCFTGWTIAPLRRGSGFAYNDQVHDQGDKVVLGIKIPGGGGVKEGEAVLDILARHPSTARFISTKLAQRFVAGDPPPALIVRMAKAFQETGGDISATMMSMIRSEEFWAAANYYDKIKTPLELVVSAARATGSTVKNGFALANEIAQLGQPLYRKLEPTGYSNVGSAWLNTSSLFARINFASSLALDKIPGVTIRRELFSTISSGAAALGDSKISARFLREIRTARVAASGLVDESNATPAMIAGLVIGSPEFQRK